MMTIEFLYSFISKNKYAVISTIGKTDLPEAALVGIAVSTDLRIIFDTSKRSRKYKNLQRQPAAALVIGWNNEQTIQYEGRAKPANEVELKELLPIYFSVFPEGRERKENSDIAYFCIIPKWIRYSDFNDPLKIEELQLNVFGH